MRLRLYHHHDGARVAYREAGTGRGLVLSAFARPLAPRVGAGRGAAVGALPRRASRSPIAWRFRGPPPASVLAGLAVRGNGRLLPRCGGHPAAAGRARHRCRARPARGDHRPARARAARPHVEPAAPPRRVRRPARGLADGLPDGGGPGLDFALSYGAKVVFRPSLGERLSAQRNPAARDLVRHAFADVGGNGNRARSWAKFARRWPASPQRQLLDAYPRISSPVLLLWAEDDPGHPLVAAQEALDVLPDAQLRTLPGTGFLMAYDDPVGVARELIAFCG